jgi:UDP-N-acetylmuramate dehydrogenase
VEVGDLISGVVCFDLKERKKVKFSREECRYGYRDSFFKQPEAKGRYVVTSVLLRLTRKHSPRLEYKGVREALGGQDPATPQQVREAIIRIRRQKLPDPDELGSAGSFFKNPVVGREDFARISPDGSAPHYDLPDGTVKVPAAWLIDQCGFKGATEGGAAVYEKQPLVLVNQSGEASPEDVLALEQRIINGVQERFGVTLHPEVEHI